MDNFFGFLPQKHETRHCTHPYHYDDNLQIWEQSDEGGSRVMRGNRQTYEPTGGDRQMFFELDRWIEWENFIYGYLAVETVAVQSWKSSYLIITFLALLVILEERAKN